LRQAADTPIWVIGNRQLVAQALANLTDNAIKYTPEGGEVRISTLSSPARLIVEDTGPGIPSALRDRALERFVRLDPDRSEPGNGLGLSLVSAVARLHDASLRLEDNSPHGLVVTMTFRSLAAVPEEAGSTAQPMPREALLH
jgi:signal transduction histidine kinase